jgi:G6PDH family F420-dependent oxidoreductase
MQQRSIELIEQAKQAEAVGLQALWISDHFHPWNDEQGQSPFVREVIGAPLEVTSLHIATAVTCPTTRIHPAVIAQAAATAAVQLRGAVRVGVGSGEALNEHIFGDP